MIVTYRRVGRISLLPALAAVAGAVIVAGVVVIPLVVLGVATYGIRLVRAIGRGSSAERQVALQDHTIIEGVVLDSTDVP
jgi:hypothetical protein